MEMDIAYKKAYRHYRKSRQPATTSDLSAFRQVEKVYKARFPPPDLDSVLDFAKISHHSVEAVCINEGTAFITRSVPGLVILPSFVRPQHQRQLIRDILRDHARFPNETNLDTHYILPREGLWCAHAKVNHHNSSLIQPRTSRSTEDPSLSNRRELINNPPGTLDLTPKPHPIPSSTLSPISVSNLLPKLRWANLGYLYHWGSKSYDFARPQVAFPQDVKAICQTAVRAINWHQVWSRLEEHDGDWGETGPDWDKWHDTYEPDAGIINFYQLKDTLMGHVDRSELSATSPLVSISLGNSAIFLIGGLTRDVKPLPILLRSGDVVIMSGPHCRRAYHGVPRILEGTLPSYLSADVEGEGADWPVFSEYLKTTRININARQVFPPHFDKSKLWRCDDTS